MPMTQQSVTLAEPSPGVVSIAIGSESYDLPISRIVEIWNGERPIEILLFQFHIILQAAGVNPNTATAAQIKAAIEAHKVWWGN